MLCRGSACSLLEYGFLSLVDALTLVEYTSQVI